MSHPHTPLQPHFPPASSQGCCSPPTERYHQSHKQIIAFYSSMPFLMLFLLPEILTPSASFLLQFYCPSRQTKGHLVSASPERWSCPPAVFSQYFICPRQTTKHIVFLTQCRYLTQCLLPPLLWDSLRTCSTYLGLPW